MTGEELRDARRILGERWGLGRPLKMSEMGRLLRLRADRDPGESVHNWERKDGPTGPVSVAVEMMLAGAAPPDIDEVLGR